MNLTSSEIKAAFKADPAKTAQALGVMLRDFGYGIDNGTIEKEIQRLLDGGQAHSGPSMSLARWLENGIE